MQMGLRIRAEQKKAQQTDYFVHRSVPDYLEEEP